ncbi:esterase-like activity of phytase family protein [Sphingomonas sp.]|uniref:esterase-like activity of phytase family protein n=1 Tax=Sphingomonas sp. TaxID=28214 RepID=UPI00286E81DE|nr:esterase-like activity of phytase family protein [Sphingomonas sp.]
MTDSTSTGGERTAQPRLSRLTIVAGFALAAIVFLAEDALLSAPRHSAPGHRSVALEFTPVDFAGPATPPLQLAGAWRLRADDRRLGGVSALAVAGGGLVAITDSGAVLRFPKPGANRPTIAIDLLPGEPGQAPPKSSRDSEALARDPQRRGWWVAFENRNLLRLYDHRFNRSLATIRFARDRWPRNAGIEGVAAAPGALLLFPELGTSVVRVTGARAVEFPLDGAPTRIADAAWAGGRLLLLERQPSLLGFTSALVEVRRAGGGYVKGRRYPLALGPRDNPEALAAEPLPGGGTRLWLMTDDNHQPWMRTLLVAYDLKGNPPAL